jgi:DNA-binding SARP family transcriptional activator/tetratricopeptide (TPR) repeat protein
MAADMAFSLLGPLAVRADGLPVPIPAGKQRVLLAALLLQAGGSVTGDHLAELLWGPDLPPSAVVTLHNYVKRLRQAFGAERHRIVTQPGGYLIRVHPGELDVTAMEDAIADAHGAAQAEAWPQAARHADAALSYWRGKPLCDVGHGVLFAQETSRLSELRILAWELRIEAHLQLGEHARLVAEARQLVAEEPLREHTHALLIRTLHESGRRAEALQTYQDARSMLVEELGCEPGPELQALHRKILDDYPVPPPIVSGTPAHGQELPPPRQLPSAVGCFTGRAAELASLDGLRCPEPGSRTLALVIPAIGGTAGVGKTALAVHWAHQVAEQFPDGQLYVNLRGYDPREPVSTNDALAGFLRALGVPGQQIPDEIDDRARLYRSKVAGRRVLVLLDNARDGEQVRPLLPGDPGCVAVVTSRDTLAGLVATDGAWRIDLDVLPVADAIGLLRSLIGSRADTDPAALAELAALCAGLPLALRIAAEQAAARQQTSLRALTAELQAARLDSLDAGEARADVRAVFSWSYRQLPGDVAEAFALLGLHPGDDLDVHAAAALTGASTGQARRILRRLHRASLVQAAGPGRYGMHDLLRVYGQEQLDAREQVDMPDVGPQRSRALTQLFDYYLTAAATAMNILHPAEAHRRPRIPPSAAVVPTMPSEADARAWLDAERANLVAIVVYCADRGWLEHAARLSGTLFRYLMTGSHLAEADIIYSHALQAACQCGDLAAEAAALNRLGGISLMKGHVRDAAGRYQTALARYRQCGDRASEGRVLENLGGIEGQLHNYQAAAGYYRQAIAACQDVGDSLGAAAALSGLASAETELGEYDQAAEHLQLTLDVFRDEKDHVREAQTLGRLGELSLHRGQLAQASHCFERALAISRRLDKPTGVAAQLLNLATVSVRQGQYQKAIGNLRRALPLYRKAGYRYGEINTLRTLAEALSGLGQPVAGRAQLETALGLAAETGSTHQQASVHRDLAESHHSDGEDGQARAHWQRAVELYTQLGALDEEAQVRSRLSQLDAGTQADGGRVQAALA